MDRHPEIDQRMQAYLRQVERALSATLPEERADILQDLQAHIYEALKARTAAPTVADVDAVLAEMPAPESYAESASGMQAEFPPEIPMAPAPTAAPRLDGLAVVALVCPLTGVLLAIAALLVRTGTLILVGYLLLLLGLIFGIVSLIRIGASRGRLTGLALAISGLILSGFLLLLSVFAIFFFTASHWKSSAATGTGAGSPMTHIVKLHVQRTTGGVRIKLQNRTGAAVRLTAGQSKLSVNYGNVTQPIPSSTLLPNGPMTLQDGESTPPIDVAVPPGNEIISVTFKQNDPLNHSVETQMVQ